MELAQLINDDELRKLHSGVLFQDRERKHVSFSV